VKTSDPILLKRNQILALVFRKFPKADKAKLLVIASAMILLSLLDLFGVALLGLVGTLSVSGIQSAPPSGTVSDFLRLLHLDGKSFQVQVALLAIIAAASLITRTILSVFFTRRTLKFFALRSAQTTISLVDRLLRTDLSYIQSKPTQESIHSVTTGASALMLGVFATSVNLLGDFSLLIVLSLGMLYVNPIVALSSIAFFALVGIAMHLLLNVRAERLGAKDAHLNIQSNSAVTEIISSFRELTVHGRQSYYIKKISRLRTDLADTQVETSFMPNISKYMVESALILGAIIISAVQFVTADASQAVATLAVFLAAGSRLAPALLRIQQGNIQIRNYLGVSRKTLALLDELPEQSVRVEENSEKLNFDHTGFIPSVKVGELSFTYPNANEPAIAVDKMLINAGQMIAIVGPSGAGKTTLVDVILGVLNPQNGGILISDTDPETAVGKWPGAISYVPQETYIADASIAENVALGFPRDQINLEFVEKSLKRAQLWEFITSLEKGLDTEVGERGTQLSGGQRQRLGIARSLYTKPKLLILDEATSSLDAETEQAISSSIHNLKGDVTLIVIAHRLSTIKEADVVHYIERGRIVGSGSFEELRRLIPSFDSSASIMGL
jgi:ABC-type multidrug transport system fused ATPase/permease subunit